MLRRTGAAGLLLATALACGPPGEQDDDASPLVDAHAALCEAAAQPDRARALFFDRAHDALHAVARDLQDTDRGEAAALLEAKQRVESELAASGQTPPEDVLRLAEVYRASLGRLAITAPPCDK